MAFYSKIDVPDQRQARPVSITEKRSVIREVYRFNGWGPRQHPANCETVNLPVKRVEDYSEGELDVFIRDFEQRKMLLFLD